MNLQRRESFSIRVARYLCAACVDAFAQVPTGTILGTVRDAQGLSVAGATVVLTNQGTASTQTDATSTRGGFQFTHLNVGVYQIEVSKSGFKNSVVTSIKLDASTEYSVPPITIDVGPVTDTVTVEAGPNLVRTAGAEITDTVEREQIEELPLLDRNPINFCRIAGRRKPEWSRPETVINGQTAVFQ